VAESKASDQKFCTNCRSELRLGNRFCTSCGALNNPPMLDIDKEQFTNYVRNISSSISRSAYWVKETGKRQPGLTSIVSLIGIVVLLSVAKTIAYLPLIGGFLSFVSYLAMVPFFLALIPPALEWHKKQVQLNEERRRQEAIQVQRAEEERRRREEELRQQQLAYERWFASLSPAEQQVELTKQMMIRQEQHAQQIMAQQNNIHQEQEKANNWRTAALLFGLMNNNHNHRR